MTYFEHTVVLVGFNHENLRWDAEGEILTCKRCGLCVPANEPRHPILGSPMEWIENGDYPGYWLCRRCANE